jgi:hypothetical protein
MPLHKQEIISQELVRNSPSGIRVMFMTIDSTKNDRCPIYNENSVLQLRIAKPDALFDERIPDGEYEMVEIWCLSCPFLGVLHRNAKRSRVRNLLFNKLMLMVKKLQTDRDTSDASDNFHGQCPVFVL